MPLRDEEQYGAYREERNILQNTMLGIIDSSTPEELWARYAGKRQFTPEQEKLITEPYHFQHGDKTPRYYQRVAINRTIEAVALGENRILLVMATGTGKTYTAFQIIHRLWKSGTKRKILFLADRNILVDQTEQQDFKPFAKISGKKLDSSYEVYLSLYQQLAGGENDEPFREFQPNFFDLIVVDKCHRGSAREDSRWRKILEYFSEATQIGMTATPSVCGRRLSMRMPISPQRIQNTSCKSPAIMTRADYFIAEDSKYPVIVTTSKLMTTGVNCKTCKLIVLDNNINSMTEFKQIIGRGTRLRPEYYVDGERHSKEYFTIMDFRNVCRLFADPEFDGDPIPVDGEDDDRQGKNSRLSD